MDLPRPRYFDESIRFGEGWRMTHRLNRWLLVLVLLIAVPFWWLLIDDSSGNARPKPIHIAQLRQLAAAMPGPLPTALTYTMVANRLIPGDMFAAGIGLKRRPLTIIAWFLPVPGRGPIMIDTGTSPANAQAQHFKNFDRARQYQIEQEAADAGVILVTHEHLDSIGGLLDVASRPGGDKALRKAALNAAQLPVVRPASQRRDQHLPAPRIIGIGPQAMAPGVVVIPAPSHTPGAQLIFVRLADGREFLFTGDISTLQENWAQLRARSRLVTDWLVPENRDDTFGWLLTIRQLQKESPKLTVVPGHDYEWVINQRNWGHISEARPPPITVR
jgi:glyoxylase-like metal-dependent hydrolase (beta-lactamase superfamily II)